MSYSVALPAHGSFAVWRDAARRAISHDIAPDAIDWSGDAGLFAAMSLPPTPGPRQLKVRPGFLDFAQNVHWHRAPERFHLLYQALWRLSHAQGDPLSPADVLGRRLHLLDKSVRRDIHKMHAFVRFREITDPDALAAAPNGARRRFAAWFEPEHHILEPGSGFFVKRFADMDWLIATPERSAIYRDGALSFAAAGPRPDLPEDASASLWATYFANIFNPARVKLQAMRSEMPKKYWKNLPETRLIPAMLADAEARVARMQAAAASPVRPGAAAISTRYRASMPQAVALPDTLEEARSAALHCRRCALCEAATQTVWGKGAPDARVMILGEQPGDHEDLAGLPFIGPAGQLLHQLLQVAALPEAQLYLTNAVKHFKFAPRGKQRLHQSPEHREIVQCRWWLGLELGFVAPKLVVALGASAAFALTDDASPMAARRGRLETGLHGGPVLPTWHPSYLLRLPDPAARAKAEAELLEDLQQARQWL